jgi:IS5 family transposase
VTELEVVLERTTRVIGQTRTRLGGATPDAATRLVSLHDPDARPIRKGRLGKPVEFGYKAQVVDNVDGIVVDHSVHRGNPADALLLVRAGCSTAARQAEACRGQHGAGATPRPSARSPVKHRADIDSHRHPSPSSTHQRPTPRPVVPSH